MPLWIFLVAMSFRWENILRLSYTKEVGWRPGGFSLFFFTRALTEFSLEYQKTYTNNLSLFCQSYFAMKYHFFNFCLSSSGWILICTASYARSCAIRVSRFSPQKLFTTDRPVFISFNSLSIYYFNIPNHMKVSG